MLLKTVDKIAKGRGLALAQAKVTHVDGSVDYHISKPQLRPWDVVGWAWYFAHVRDLKRSRA